MSEDNSTNTTAPTLEPKGLTTGQEPSQPSNPIPNQQAIDMLRQSPDQSHKFDQVFGEGAAAQYLQPAQEETPGEEGSGEGFEVPLVPRFVSSGIRNAAQSALNVWNEAGQHGGTMTIGMDGWKPTVKFHGSVEALEADGGETAQIVLPEAAEPETALGKMGSAFVQFGVGFAATPIKGVGMAGMALKGAVADATFMDGEEGNLSTLLEETEVLGMDLSNPVTGFLNSKSDNFWEGRLKNALEGSIIGVGIDGLVSGLRVIKEGRKVAKEGPEAVQAALSDPDSALMKAVKANDDLAKMVDEQPPKTVDEFAEEVVNANSAEALSKRVSDRVLNDIMTEFTPDKDVWDELVTSPDSGDLPPAFFKMTGEDDLKTVIQAHADIITARAPGAFDDTMTMAQVRAEAEEIGVTLSPGELLGELEDSAFIREFAPKIKVAKAFILASADTVVQLDDQILNLRQALPKGADETGKLSQAVKALEEQRDSALNYGLALTTHTNDVIKGSARITSLARDDVVVRGRNMKETMEIFAGADGDKDILIPRLRIAKKNPTGMKKIADHVLRNRTWDMINEYYINSLLSGPVTHVVNATSNMLETVVRPAEYMLGGAAHGNKELFMEGVDRYVGIATYMSDSAKLGLQALRQGDNILDPMHMVQDAPTGAIRIKARPGDTQAGEAVRKTVNAFGEVVRIPSRFLMASDEFFKQLNFRASLKAQLTRQGREQGLSGTKLATHIETEMDRLITELSDIRAQQAKGAKPSKKIDQKLSHALNEAREATFTQDLEPGTIGKGFQDMVNAHPYLRLIAPFVRTPANLMSNAFGRTPGVSRIFKRGKQAIGAGGETRQLQHGREILGTMILGTAAVLAANGKITGALHTDPEVRKHMFDAGQLPYAFKFGDRYIQFNRMDPRFTMFGITADIIERYADLQGPNSKVEVSEIIGTLGLSLSSNLLSKSYVKGISDSLETLTSNDENKWEKTLGNLAGAFAPFSSFQRQITDETPELLAPRSILDAALKDLPGGDDRTDLKRNVLGDPIIRPHFDFPGGWAVASPFAHSKLSSEPALHAFAKLGRVIRMPPKKPAWTFGIDLTEYRQENGRTLYDKWQELTGTVQVNGMTLRQTMNTVTASRDFRGLLEVSLPDDPKSPAAEAIGQILSAYRKKAAATMLMTMEDEIPAIAQFKEDLQSAKIEFVTRLSEAPVVASGLEELQQDFTR